MRCQAGGERNGMLITEEGVEGEGSFDLGGESESE